MCSNPQASLQMDSSPRLRMTKKAASGVTALPSQNLQLPFVRGPLVLAAAGNAGRVPVALRPALVLGIVRSGDPCRAFVRRALPRSFHPRPLPTDPRVMSRDPELPQIVGRCGRRDLWLWRGRRRRYHHGLTHSNHGVRLWMRGDRSRVSDVGLGRKPRLLARGGIARRGRWNDVRSERSGALGHGGNFGYRQS